MYSKYIMHFLYNLLLPVPGIKKGENHRFLEIYYLHINNYYLELFFLRWSLGRLNYVIKSCTESIYSIIHYYFSLYLYSNLYDLYSVV